MRARAQASKAIAAVSSKLKGQVYSNDEVDARWETEKIVHAGWLTKEVRPARAAARSRQSKAPAVLAQAADAKLT